MENRPEVVRTCAGCCRHKINKERSDVRNGGNRKNVSSTKSNSRYYNYKRG